MCGIFGYIGPQDSKKVCLNGLKMLEYRGYDSAGIAGTHKGELLSFKQAGKVKFLEEIMNEHPLPLDLAIAHTRWATHGPACKENAHPHLDASAQIAVVHNGIIENHDELRDELTALGVDFASDTDTEIIAQLVAHYYKGNLKNAFIKTLNRMEGAWGIALIHKDHPGEIYVAAKESSIAIAIDKESKEAYVSSDANTFSGKNLDVLFLNNHEFGCLKAGEFELFDQVGYPIKREMLKLKLSNHTISKNGYEHYMLKEIFEQPETIHHAFFQRYSEDFGTATFPDLAFSTKELQSVRHILILACGTSWHAGCIAASLLEEKARIPTQTEIASEFRYRNPIVNEETLVIAISQSGETLDTIAAVREVKAKGAKVLAICNVPNSTLTREAHTSIFLNAGPEVSVCSTKAFTSQLCVLSLFTLMMARLRHMDKEEGQEFIREMLRLPVVAQQILHKREEIERIAKKYAHFEEYFFLGRHYMYPTSLEAALKLKEISYLHATGYPAGEMKHGPIALIDANLLTIGMCGNEKTYDKILSNLMEVKARLGTVLALAPEGSANIEKVADDVIYLPHIRDEFASIPYSIAAQLLAYYIAKEHGTDIDQPRNLAKSVTVE